jgi:hypothetical protein
VGGLSPLLFSGNPRASYRELTAVQIGSDSYDMISTIICALFIVAGQQYAFGYDNAGNRGQAWSGGDVNGGNLRDTGYTTSALNQYSAASNPSYAQVIGAATAPATVTVNGGGADRKGEYYHGEVSVPNGSGPAVLAVSAVASLSGSSVTNSGSLVVSAASQSFAYDANGSLTNDGVWSFYL